MATAGIVVCGGLSRRMGSDKAWLPVAGEPCLCRVVRTLSSCLDHVLVVKRDGQSIPLLPGAASVIVDSVGNQGPLRGLLDGLRALPTNANAVFLSGCDTPFVSPEVVRFLVDSLGDADAVVPRVEGRMHSLCAAYRPFVAAKAEKLLLEGRYRMGFLLDACDVVRVDESVLRKLDPGLRSFINLNTPEDYRAIVG